MRDVFQEKAGDTHLRPGDPGARDPRQYLHRVKVAGFRDLRTGRFTEIMLIRTPGDLEEFRRLYEIEEGEITTQY